MARWVCTQGGKEMTRTSGAFRGQVESSKPFPTMCPWLCLAWPSLAVLPRTHSRVRTQAMGVSAQCQLSAGLTGNAQQ